MTDTLAAGVAVRRPIVCRSAVPSTAIVPERFYAVIERRRSVECFYNPKDRRYCTQEAIDGKHRAGAACTSAINSCIKFIACKGLHLKVFDCTTTTGITPFKNLRGLEADHMRAKQCIHDEDTTNIQRLVSSIEFART